MSAVGQPGAGPQNIHGCSREKCLKLELLAANIARSPHLTGAHGLRNRAFNSCSLGVQCPRILEFLGVFARSGGR